VHEELHLTAAASRMCELHDDLEVHVFSRRLGVVMRTPVFDQGVYFDASYPR
jgi:hypothetical protein